MLNSLRTKLLVGSAVVAALAGCNAVFGISKGELEETASDGGAGAGGGAGGSTEGGAGTSGNAGATGQGGTSTGGTAGQGGVADDTAMIEIDPGQDAFEFTVRNHDAGVQAASASFTYKFALDKYEVTSRRYKEWRDAGYPRPASGADLGMGMIWDANWNVHVTGIDGEIECGGPSEEHEVYASAILADEGNPVVCMNWYEALALCGYEGKRLPTETEWIYAATNGGSRTPYPFDGSEIDCTKATYNPGDFSYCGFPKHVGSAPAGASAHGLMDLAGSVFEWVWDQAAEYPTSGTALIDYTGEYLPVETPERVRRGGAFISLKDELQLENYEREFYPPDSRFNDAGFRCARSVQ